MLTKRATFPIPFDRDQHHHHDQQAPRASSEQEARSEPRTSTSDEAQACFNLVLLLRHDTQHLIALRNDNIQSLEELAAARPLLAKINEAITAATRSIHELGPFLERHRWPSDPVSRSSLRFKLLRRSRSLSVPSVVTTIDSGLSPDELFSWTLALTAQHNAILYALGKLERFLEHGTAALDDEDRRRHDATQSWWQQRRGEFENVRLIQSILQGPRRSVRERGADGAATVRTLPNRPEAFEFGAAVAASSPTAAAAAAAAAAILPSISEHDDGRSDTVTSYEQSIRSAPSEAMHGLTARPRARSESVPQTRFPLSCESPDVSLVAPGPWTHPQPSPAIEIQTGFYQTYGAPHIPIEVAPRPSAPRLNSIAPQRPRLAMAALPPLVGLQGLHFTVGDVPPPSSTSPSVSPCSPMMTPPGLSYTSSRVSLPSPASPASPHGAAAASPTTVNTPFTPLDQQVATMFEQKTLPTKTIQPVVVHELGSALALSPADSMSPDLLELGASPVTAASRYSQATVVPQQQGQEAHSGGHGGDDGRHWPYLAYLARKQAVATSRWSLRRSRTKNQG